jgi:hypothetical protein
LENFWSLFDTAFGTQYDYLTAFTLKSQWQSQDFSLFPQIEVVSSEVLGTAKGAYAISTNKIYLSDAFISSASQQSLEAVILEEFGHFVDAQVNTADTLGDEGELFSDLVRGVSLSAAELGRIQAEDDHAVIVIDGQDVAIEQSAVISPSTIPNGFVIDATAGSLANLGYVVKGNGDINGDGLKDFVVLAPGDNGVTGTLYVVYGGTTPTVSPNVIQLNSSTPYSVSVSLGDIDGDGNDDIIIGDRFPIGTNSVAGRTYVIWGNITATVNVSALGSQGFTIINSAGANSLGYSVSSGNIDGDLNLGLTPNKPIDDVIIGDPLNNKVYVLLGNQARYTGTFDISTASPSNLTTISGPLVSSFGFSVSSGDIGGSPEDDVIVGAPDANSFRGEAYVFFGNSNPANIATSTGSLISTNGFKFTTTNVEQLGYKVSSAGDINGGGKNDLIISAPGTANPNQRTYVIFGEQTGAFLSAGGMTAANGFYIDGLNADDSTFEAISSAGDINNDGIDDFLIAEPFANNGPADSGAVYFVYGRSGGFGSSLNLPLTPLQGGQVIFNNPFTLATNDYTGWSVSDAGDVNGDSVDDFLIGAPGANNLDGRVYVVLGTNTANPIPNTTVTINPYGLPNPLIGEDYTFVVDFDNTASGPGNEGYAPFVDLYLQTTGEDGKLTPLNLTDEDGLKLLNIKYILDEDISTVIDPNTGNSLTDGYHSVDLSLLGITPIQKTIYMATSGFFSGNLVVDHPYAGGTAGAMTILAPSGLNEGDTLYVVPLPQGSFVPDQPVAKLEVNVNISNFADYNIPLNIQTRGGFRFGANPVLDPNPIDPILDPTYTNHNLTPFLYRINKYYLGPDNETVTGPNFAQQYNITVDVAPGQTIQKLNIVDTLPNNLQYSSVISANPNPSTIVIAPPPNSPGGTLDVEVSSVFGGPSSVDANLNFEFYIPRLDPNY